jgi:hypothetical protein
VQPWPSSQSTSNAANTTPRLGALPLIRFDSESAAGAAANGTPVIDGDDGSPAVELRCSHPSLGITTSRRALERLAKAANERTE